MKYSLSIFLGLAVVVGCGENRPAPVVHKPVAATATQPALPGPQRLVERADKLWQARVDRDWKTAWEFVDPALAAQSDVDSYVEWESKNQPFQWDAFTLEEVVTEGPYAWVRVKYTARMTRYGGLPPREAEQWQKWHVVAGEWFPVDQRELDNYPAPPAMRDLAAEQKLRARVEESNRLRRAGEWAALLKLCDPADVEGMDTGAFADQQQRSTITRDEVLWLQVVGETGTVRRALRFKINDPSMQNLPEQDASSTERWVLRAGDWYRDLNPALGAAPAGQGAQ